MFTSGRTSEIKSDVGGSYGMERPDLFPNSAVKHARADDSLAHASAKVGSCPLNKTLP
jgi:hypothetical protein